MNNITHHSLKVESIADEKGPAIIISQGDPLSNDEGVIMHPWQLRAVCEELGLTTPSDPHAALTVARLSRQLRVLADRIANLSHWLHTLSDHDHANLTTECAMASALDDLAGEFVADLDASGGPLEAISCPAAPHVSGGLGKRPQEAGNTGAEATKTAKATVGGVQ